jgi:SAM-dependent methyltransferase
MEGVHAVLDIGAGPGTYPIALCKRHPHLSVTLFDLPATLDVTRKILAKEGIGRQIRLMAGDYNKDPLPKGFDVVFLSNIIHGEDEETNRRLLKKIYPSLNPGGRVLIKDHIMDESLTKPACGALFSIYMLLTTKGRDYGYHEVQQWLKEAGFVDIILEDLPPPMTSAIVSGRK